MVMRVNTVQCASVNYARGAHEKGLNVDGSREMLIAALKTVQDLESEVGSDEGSEESDEEPEED
jgi:hypothetical protein